ncbi:hypothetical protein MTYP_01737 [Methylophilaceae bacterium]|nr:hypothetical protein MTYP_01737 [Methylophilaceae bacterium]
MYGTDRLWYLFRVFILVPGFYSLRVKKHWPYFLIVFVIPVTAILWWWGLFSSATVQIAERGNYRFAYMEAEGPYSKLESKRDEVMFYLKQQNIEAIAPLSLILSDPRSTPYKALRARTGFIIGEGANIQPPLALEIIPPRKVVVAEIRAHPLFAYGKAYSALIDYSDQHRMTLHLPTLEIVKDSVLSVEMPFATDQKTAAGTGSVS